MNEISIFEAQQNKVIRNQLIQEKIPFVIYMATKTLGRYIETENDVEFLIGLEALNDAIDLYDAEKGQFETFAGTMIKHRILDEVKKNANYANHLAYGETLDDVVVQDNTDLKIELSTFKTILRTYNLAFDDMVGASPTHRDTRIRALKASKKTASFQDIIEKIKQYFKLPIPLMVSKKIETRRFLYAHKKYILFSSLAYIHHFSEITSWIDDAIGGEHDEIH
jgi:RNA polymerase sigma factor